MRPSEILNQPGRPTLGKLDEPVRHLSSIDWLESPASWNRYHRKLGHLLHKLQERLMELSGAQRRPGQTRIGHNPLGGELGFEVAEHGAIESAAHGNSLGPNNRDVHQMRRPGP